MALMDNVTLHASETVQMAYHLITLVSMGIISHAFAEKAIITFSQKFNFARFIVFAIQAVGLAFVFTASVINRLATVNSRACRAASIICVLMVINSFDPSE